MTPAYLLPPFCHAAPLAAFGASARRDITRPQQHSCAEEFQYAALRNRLSPPTTLLLSDPRHHANSTPRDRLIAEHARSQVRRHRPCDRQPIAHLLPAIAGHAL